MHNFVLLFAFLAAYAANLAFLASFSYENAMQNTDIQETESIQCFYRVIETWFLTNQHKYFISTVF